MRTSRLSPSVVAEVSRAVAERAITEREGCLELWSRTGADPRAIVRALRAGVRGFAQGSRDPLASAVEDAVRRRRDARRS